MTEHPSSAPARTDEDTGRVAGDDAALLGPALECRAPGQTGCRPLRHLTPNRDPAVLARVLDGLHRLPGRPPPSSAPPYGDRGGAAARSLFGER